MDYPAFTPRKRHPQQQNLPPLKRLVEEARLHVVDMELFIAVHRELIRTFRHGMKETLAEFSTDTREIRAAADLADESPEAVRTLLGEMAESSDDLAPTFTEGDLRLFERQQHQSALTGNNLSQVQHSGIREDLAGWIASEILRDKGVEPGNVEHIPTIKAIQAALLGKPNFE